MLMTTVIITLCFAACGNQSEPSTMASEHLAPEESFTIQENVAVEESTAMITEGKQENLLPFQLIDSFDPEGLFRIYSGGLVNMYNDVFPYYTVTYDEENQIFSLAGKEGTITEGENGTIGPFNKLAEAVYRVKATYQVSDAIEENAGYYVQQGDNLDFEKDAVDMYRYYGAKYGKNSCDVLELDKELGKARLYRFSQDGQEIESQEEYTFEYHEDDNELRLYDKEGVAVRIWQLEVSNGVVVVGDYDNLVGALARIKEMPESVEAAR